MRPALPSISRTSPGGSRRRGVTLLEMLVAVALLVMMMLVLVSIFQSATGAISEMRSYQALDEELRRIDAVFRSDLAGVTAKMTPPNNPLDGHGYFEYSEGALADAQGEDSDDTLRFTVKAPDGQPFVGRIWIPWSTTGTFSTPIAYNTTSQYAEVVYFLRNHNLYRRVFLISPQVNGRSVLPKGVSNYTSDVSPTIVGFFTTIFPITAAKLSYYSNTAPYSTSLPPSYVSGAVSTNTLGTSSAPGFVVSWLGLNDISSHPASATTSAGAPLPTALAVPIPNTLNDLTNRHNRIFNPHFANDYVQITLGSPALPDYPLGVPTLGSTTPDGKPDDLNADGINDYAPTLYYSAKSLGLINELTPAGNSASGYFGGNLRQVANADTLGFPYVYAYSTSQYVGGVTAPYGSYHSLDPTVSPVPTASRPFFGTVLDPPFNHNPIDIGDSLPQPGGTQTWWGFPTWRETLSSNWLDPVSRVNVSKAQAIGLSYITAGWLPPMTGVVNEAQLYNDGTGSANFAMPIEVGEEDLIATNVRSFDVKALEQSPLIWNASAKSYQSLPAGYYDLGYANLDLALGYTPPEFLDTFAHEGRIPPYTTDGRSDPQDPQSRPNLGDNTTGIIRMTRTWDSWSTDYTSVPGMPLYPENGPLNGLPSVMPSYPAPYPIPMRGIQIQIRITDPENQHVKSLTIRQDFTDKL